MSTPSKLTAVIVVKMYVNTFKTDIIVFIVNVIMCLTSTDQSVSVSPLILTISLNDINWPVSQYQSVHLFWQYPSMTSIDQSVSVSISQSIDSDNIPQWEQAENVEITNPYNFISRLLNANRIKCVRKDAFKDLFNLNLL